jgi:hypothetical protein
LNRATHVEFHPVGSEWSATWCRAIAASIEEPDRFFVHDGSVTQLHPDEAAVLTSQFMPIARPFVLQDNESVFAIGTEIATWLTILTDDPVPADYTHRYLRSYVRRLMRGARDFSE